ncbi:MAG TPA: hypothetical protein VG056_02600, partial [Pirellulales bacterium]|nr:hypothetical protein [Pirellulales bacterium]
GTGGWRLGAGAVGDGDFGEFSRTGRGATGEEDHGTAADAKVNPSAPIIRGAARLALVATLLQIPVGLWVLFALPTAVQSQLLGEDWIATLLFGLSVIVALGLMHQLAMASLGAVSRQAVGRTALLLAAVVFLMVATLHRARQCVLEPARTAMLEHSLCSSSLSLWERAGVREIRNQL